MKKRREITFKDLSWAKMHFKAEKDQMTLARYLRAIDQGKVKEYHDSRDPYRAGGKYRKKD